MTLQLIVMNMKMTILETGLKKDILVGEENSRGFSIQYLFAKFTLNQRNKTYTNML